MSRNVPRLRFKKKDGSEYEKWIRCILGDLTEQISVRNSTKKNLPIYSINNVNGFTPQDVQFDRVNSNTRGYDTSIYKVISKKTFAYNPARINVGSIGYSGIIDNILISSLYVCFKANERVDDFFLWHFLKGEVFNREVKRNTEGGVREYLFYNNFSRIPIKIPQEIEEQLKISTFLSTLDSRITTQSEKVNSLQELKKGLMQKIFSQEIRFRREDGSEYPEWEEKTISEVAVCLDFMRRPINTTERNKIKGSIPYYGANGIQGYINNFIFDESLVLLAEDGGNFDDFKNTAIAQYVEGKSWINNHAHVLRANEDAKFLYYSLVHKDIRAYINGTSRSKLNQADMLTIIVHIPKIEEQQKVSTFLSTLDSKIDTENQILTTLQTLKKGLLQQMFV